jgi:hypothetical protein
MEPFMPSRSRRSAAEIVDAVQVPPAGLFFEGPAMGDPRGGPPEMPSTIGSEIAMPVRRSRIFF